MNVDSYRRRRKGKPEWTVPTTDLGVFLKDTFALLEQAPGNAMNLSVSGAAYGPDRKLAYVKDKLPRLLANEPPGTRIVIACDRAHDGPEFAVQRIRTELQPLPTEGSPAIDLIYAAAVADFGPKSEHATWGLFDVGIYVAKPGEHGATGPGWRGNAVDFEFRDSLQDDAESRAKLWTMAQAMVEMEAKGLPVGGVIAQGRWWSPSSGGWHPYKVGYSDSERHFTHNHFSGSPEQVVGWI